MGFFLNVSKLLNHNPIFEKFRGKEELLPAAHGDVNFFY